MIRTATLPDFRCVELYRRERTLKSTKLKITIVMASSLAVAACNLLLGGGYEVSDTPGDGGPGNGSVDGSGDGSRVGNDSSCIQDPASVTQFESTCTSAACNPFDNKRLTVCEAGASGYVCPEATANPVVDAAAAPVDAGGLPRCSEIPGSASATGGLYPANAVYAIGGDAMLPFAGRIGQLSGDQNIATMIYTLGVSCLNITAMLNSTPLATIAPTAFYFEPKTDSTSNAVVQKTCVMDQPDRIADFSISNAFATTCATLPQGLPASFSEALGPVLVVEFAVPGTSSQTSISADAAHVTFGLGGTSAVAPWTDPDYVNIRGAQAGVVLTPAPIIGVAANRWKGKVQKTSATLLADMIAANTAGGAVADKTIGIIAATDLDPRRAQLKPLSFQDYGQTCGYYADSTATAFDKQNVRDGHYPIWSSTHFINRVNAQGAPLNALAKQIIDVMQGAQSLQGLDILQLYAQGHVIPNCAMHVRRQADAREYTSFKPQNSCSCYFDVLATGTTSCTSCKSSSDCATAPGGATQCNLFGNPAVGYCEPPGAQ